MRTQDAVGIHEIDLDPKIFLVQPQRRWEVAWRKVLYEMARACHGALWRDTAGGRELNEAFSNGMEYDKGINALNRFVQEQPKSCDDIELAIVSVVHVICFRRANNRKFEESARDTFEAAGFEAACLEAPSGTQREGIDDPLFRSFFF